MEKIERAFSITQAEFFAFYAEVTCKEAALTKAV